VDKQVFLLPGAKIPGITANRISESAKIIHAFIEEGLRTA
jgi:hypothetical protein